MRPMTRFSFSKPLLLLPFLLATLSASAATTFSGLGGTVYSVSGESVGERGDDGNTRITLDFSVPGGQGPINIGTFGWNLMIETVGASWLSEATIGFEDSAGNLLREVRPGMDDNFSGTATYMSEGNVDGLIPFGGPMGVVVDDGLLVINFYEAFDNAPGMVDAFFSGSVAFTVSPVPVPAAGLLFLSALGALGIKSGAARIRARTV